MMSIIIDVGTKFSRSPIGRYYSDGNNSGARFRDEILKPVLTDSDELVILDFSNVNIGVGSSFLEESFGGLVREGFDAEELKRRIKIEGGMAAYPSQVIRFVDRAKSHFVKG
ncbi:STAS-like domain-containing protein [Aeromonas molluscorum]|uniref:STAS-like domain-containing protein n=1 Tax=Aeromonas molluscorum TaxID=271417 RepID=UPI003F1C9A79